MPAASLRSSRASREIRVPFLDYRLIEACVRHPESTKLNAGWTKYFFRRAMEPFLPREIVWRKDKRGFVTPQSEWLKHDLKAVVDDHFAEDALIFKHGLVNRTALLEMYAAFRRQPPKGGRIFYRDIFNPLSLEVWLRQYEEYLAA